jgi:hypothetical protein
MGVTVSVNGRTVIHRGSEGMALGSPDVCKTPKSGEPVPYVNLAVSADLEAGAISVFVDGYRVAKASSYLARSTGDEPGTDGGVISGCNLGKASWITFSFDVLVEGEPVPRALDLTVQNHGSPANTPPIEYWQRLVTENAFAIVCAALCTCHALRQKMECFKPTMASRGRARPVWGGPETVVWDSFFPGLYIEPSFGPVGPLDKPTGEWDVIPSKAKSRWKDAKGKPLPVPAGEWIPSGSKRPDVAVARDPQKPLTKANVKEIIEVKFPGDRWRKGQKAAYKKLLPPGATLREASPESCLCPGLDKKRLRRPFRFKLPKGWRLPKQIEQEILGPDKKEVERPEVVEPTPPLAPNPPPFDLDEFLEKLPPLVPLPIPILQRIPQILRGPPIIIIMPPGGLLPPEPPVA